jgi:hypothetical protein
MTRSILVNKHSESNHVSTKSVFSLHSFDIRKLRNIDGKIMKGQESLFKPAQPGAGEDYVAEYTPSNKPLRSSMRTTSSITSKFEASSICRVPVNVDGISRAKSLRVTRTQDS